MTTELTEFQYKATVATLRLKLLQGSYFDICVLDAVAKTLDRTMYLGGADYTALRGLHCVHWADMGPELTHMTRKKVLEMLGMEAELVGERPPETDFRKSWVARLGVLA